MQGVDINCAVLGSVEAVEMVRNFQKLLLHIQNQTVVGSVVQPLEHFVDAILV